MSSPAHQCLSQEPLDQQPISMHLDARSRTQRVAVGPRTERRFSDSGGRTRWLFVVSDLCGCAALDPALRRRAEPRSLAYGRVDRRGWLRRMASAAASTGLLLEGGVAGEFTLGRSPLVGTRRDTDGERT